jgi:predicted transposase/invertase (TIGR01784 family)
MSLINPRVDIAFKKIFGVEENKDILISLLNSIISEEDQVDEIELLNPYNERNFKKDKLSILDIKARNKHTKTHFLIEMQLAEEVDYPKRGLYSWARVYSNQLGAGKLYEELNRTIAIHILNFTFIDYSKEKGWIESAPSKYHHIFVLSDKETRLEIFKDIEIHTIELNKFEGIKDKDIKVVMPRVKDMLDRWVAVLTKYDLFNIKDLPEEVNIPEIKKALRVMEEMTMNEEERDVYNSHLDFLRMEHSAFEARFIAGLKVGEAKGRAEGEAKGRAEGEAKGIEKGIKEGAKLHAIKTATILLGKGLDIQLIVESTGLSAEEIEKLRK